MTSAPIKKPKNILIFGATGTIGQPITNAILNAKTSFWKIGIFTSAQTVERKRDLILSFKHRGAELIVGDIEDEESISDAYKGYDTVISCLGRTSIHTQLLLIRLAEQSSTINWFFPSEYGTDVDHDNGSAYEPLHQPKLEVRHYIEQHTTRLNHCYLVTGPYPHMWFSKTPDSLKETGSWDVANRSAVLLGDGETRIGFTTMDDVGKLLVKALLHPEAVKNRALRVCSFSATPNQVLAEFERQTSELWHVEHTDLEVLRGDEAKAWEERNPYASVFSTRRIWAEGGANYETWDNELIEGSDTETLQSLVMRAIEDAKRS